MRSLLIFLMLFGAPIAAAAEQAKPKAEVDTTSFPEGFGPPPRGSVESRLYALEIAVQGLEKRMTDVEKIANEEFIRKIATEVVTAKLGIRTASGQVETRTISYAGLGSFELGPNETLYSVNGQLVGQPIQQSFQMGQPVSYYCAGGQCVRMPAAPQYRTSYSPGYSAPMRTVAPRRVFIGSMRGNCANGMCGI